MPSHISRNSIDIPKGFRRALPLGYEDETNWLLQFGDSVEHRSRVTFNQYYKSLDGWARFRVSHGIVECDNLRFTLIDDEVYRVDILPPDDSDSASDDEEFDPDDPDFDPDESESELEDHDDPDFNPTDEESDKSEEDEIVESSTGTGIGCPPIAEADRRGQKLVGHDIPKEKKSLETDLDATESQTPRVANIPKKKSLETDLDATESQTPRVAAYELETCAYWRSQIKLAESIGKHSVSAAFFALARECCKAEPIRHLRLEVKEYLSRHESLSADEGWIKLCVGYGLAEYDVSRAEE